MFYNLPTNQYVMQCSALAEIFFFSVCFYFCMFPVAYCVTLSAVKLLHKYTHTAAAVGCGRSAQPAEH